MKKITIVTALVLLICVAGAVLFSGCAGSSDEVVAETKEGNEALQLRDKFFAETLNSQNVTVTVDEGIYDVFVYVETIADGIDCIDVTENGYEDNLYKEYYFAEESEGSTYYYYLYEGGSKWYTKETNGVDLKKKYYTDGICFYDDITDEEGVECTCSIKGNKLTFKIIYEGKSYATLVAKKEGQLVTSVSYTWYNAIYDANVVRTMTFVYGEGHLTKPDLTDFVQSKDDDYLE